MKGGYLSHLYTKKKIWYISFYLYGKQYKKSLKTRSKTIALDIQKKIDYEISAGNFELNKYFSKSVLRLDEFIDWALNISTTNKNANTTRIDRRAFKSFRDFTGDITIKQIDFSLCENYKAQLLKKKLSKNTINMYIRHLKASFQMGVDAELFEKNPFEKVKQIKIGKSIPKFLSYEQAEEMLELAKSSTFYIYILIALQTGARASEVANIKWEDIDFRNKLIVLDGKGKKKRTVPIPDRLYNALNNRKEDKGYVVKGSRDVTQIGKNFRKFADALNLKQFTFHDLRHTYASWLAQSGVNVKIIQEILGHQSITTTMIYTHLVPESKVIAATIMNQILKPNKNS